MDSCCLPHIYFERATFMNEVFEKTMIGRKKGLFPASIMSTQDGLSVACQARAFHVYFGPARTNGAWKYMPGYVPSSEDQDWCRDDPGICQFGRDVTGIRLSREWNQCSYSSLLDSVFPSGRCPRYLPVWKRCHWYPFVPRVELMFL